MAIILYYNIALHYNVFKTIIRQRRNLNMQPYESRVRPYSPINIRTRSPKLHECPNCSCYQNENKSASAEGIGLAYRPLSPGFQTFSPINSFYRPASPIIHMPTSSSAQFQVQKINIVPASYNRRNIYYNRPIDKNSSTISNSSHKSSVQPSTIFRQQKLTQKRLQSPPFFSYIKPKVNIRYMNHLNQVQQFPIKSNIVQENPKTPDILKHRKPAVKRVHSSSAEKKIVKQVVSIYNNNNNEANNVQSIFVKDRVPLPQAIKINVNRVADNVTTQVNSQNYSLDQVTATPIKQTPTSMQKNSIKGWEHVYEEDHHIASILADDLKLNYDYFGKNELTDRSISDHVQL